jgi:hypothetical protein
MDLARLTPQPKKMEDRRWKMGKVASASESMIWNDVRGKFAQENKTFRDSNTDYRRLKGQTRPSACICIAIHESFLS